MLWKTWIEDFSDLSNSCKSICFHDFVLSCGLSKQMWPLRNLKWFFDVITAKVKWLSFENILSVIWRFTPGISLKHINPNNASISALSVFLTHVYLPYSLNLSLRCKRAIDLFILVFVQSTILSMISLSKYKWQVVSMFSILFTLEFGTRQLVLPKMVSHFCCLPAATGCSDLHQIFFVFLSFFGPRYPQSSSKTPSLFIHTISL